MDTDPIEPEPYDARSGGPSPILEGEILPYIDGIDPETGKRRRGYAAYVDEEIVRQVIYERAKGRAVKDIAEEFGISKSTVSNWYRGEVRKRTDNPQKAAEYRARLTLELEALAREVWQRQIGAAPEDLRTQAEAWRRLESLVKTRADLNGAMPEKTIRANVHITEQTQADLELQDMINSAKAKNAAVAAEVETDFRQSGQGSS